MYFNQKKFLKDKSNFLSVNKSSLKMVTQPVQVCFWSGMEIPQRIFFLICIIKAQMPCSSLTQPGLLQIIVSMSSDENHCRW